MPRSIISLTCLFLCFAVLPTCSALKRSFTPPPPREVRVDARDRNEEISHVFVYDFASQYQKPAGTFQLRSDFVRARNDMETGFDLGMNSVLMKRRFHVHLEMVSDLKNNGGTVEAYIAAHRDSERASSARYRLVLDPWFSYLDREKPQIPEGSVTLTVTLTRIKDDKLIWEAVYRRWTSGYYYNGGYASMAEKAAEEALDDLFGAQPR